MSEYGDFIGFLTNRKEAAVTPESQPESTLLERAKELRLKHASHNQASHGFRFGKTPSLEQARRYRKAGVLNEYSKRARERSGTRPAKQRNAEKPKMPKGNGHYGEDGTATSKQADYANSLKAKQLEKGYDSLYGNLYPRDRANMVLELIPHMSGGIVGGLSDAVKDKLARKLHNEATDWLRTTNPARMSKGGVSSFLDRIRVGSISALLGSLPDRSAAGIANFLNGLYGNSLFTVRNNGERDLVTST